MLRNLVFLFALSLSTLGAQPVINAVVSAAGEVTDVSPGGIASVWGLDHAHEPLNATVIPLPLTLDGTRVFINGVECPLFFVSEFQINLQVPFETPTDIEVVVQVEHDGEISDEFTIIVKAVAVSVFTYERVPQSGVFEPLVLHSDGVTLVTPENPAKLNEVIVLYLTGFPQVLNAPLTGLAAPAPPNDAVTVQLPSVLLNTNAAGAALNVQYSGLASGFVGLWQLNTGCPPAFRQARISA